MIRKQAPQTPESTSTPAASSPGTAEIEMLLEGIRPLPSTAFYERMEHAPWQQAQSATRSADHPCLHALLASWMQNGSLRPWILSGLASAVIVGTALIQPDLRALAQDALLFFTRAEADRLAVEFTPVTAAEAQDITMSGPAFVSIDGEEADPAATVVLAGVPEPGYLPPGYSLQWGFAPEGAGFATASYDGGENNMLSIMQTVAGAGEQPTAMAAPVTIFFDVARSDEVPAPVPSDDAPHMLSLQVGPGSAPWGKIGASAEILKVDINGQPGEYVKGAWRPTGRPLNPGLLEPGETVRIEHVWDSDAPFQVLRWQSGGSRYEIMAHGDRLTLNDLLAVARSL